MGSQEASFEEVMLELRQEGGVKQVKRGQTGDSRVWLKGS